MKKILFLLLFITASFFQQSYAHSGKPKYHVIIDTDGAIDDMRAISMLLSGNDIRVLAFTCSQGSLSPNVVFQKITSLLSSFHHEGIPAGISEGTDFDLPPWEPFAKSVRWADFSDTLKQGQIENSIHLLNRTVKNYKNKLTLIALGSLKTYADWLQSNPEVIAKIDRIIWYNSFNIYEGFNYKVSPESYNYIQESGIKLEIISNTTTNYPVNKAYLQQIDSSHTIYGDQIQFAHNQKSVKEKIKKNHLQLWDDLIPLFLTTPLIFDTETKDNTSFVSVSKNIPASYLYEIIGNLLASSSVTNNRVFSSFPINKDLYKSAYADIIQNTIKKYGIIEWKAICMTNEIHGHTGIYSIIGAKMGIRATEYFNVGVNNLEVISYAGLKPPLSCFNDGIQISTGATIGQGLITVSDTVSKIPSATFEFNDQKVTLSLKAEIAEQMRNDIQFAIQKYGLLTDQYWQYIEELAIRYWVNYDRHDIFIIQKVILE